MGAGLFSQVTRETWEIKRDQDILRLDLNTSTNPSNGMKCPKNDSMDFIQYYNSLRLVKTVCGGHHLELGLIILGSMVSLVVECCRKTMNVSKLTITSTFIT